MSIGTLIILLLVFIAATLFYLSNLLGKVSIQYIELKNYLETQIDTTPLINAQKEDIKTLSTQVDALSERFGELGELLLRILNQGKLTRESIHLVDTRLAELSPEIKNITLTLTSLEKPVLEESANVEESV